MDRLACIDLPAFPLQLLLIENPKWQAFPAAVIDRDSPQGIVLWANEHAHRTRVLPGLRYAAALSIAHNLRAGTMTEEAIGQGIDNVCAILRDFTPAVEPSHDMPGVFWLDAAGLDLLFPSLDRWARSIRTRLRAAGFHVGIAVGFGRFGTYALARSGSSIRVVESPQVEHAATRQVRLDRLDFVPSVRDTLAELGVITIGDLLSLPAGGLRKRFGQQAYNLYQLADGHGWSPLQAEHPEPRSGAEQILDHAFSDTPNLLFILRQILDTVLAALADRAQALVELIIEFTLERAPAAHGHEIHTEKLRPAEPTLDRRILINLIRLRLESLTLPRGVIEIRAHAAAMRASVGQLELFDRNPGRDLCAGERALARIRAEFGDAAVVHARRREGHLPEATYAWAPLETLAHAEPRNVRTPGLIRRIHTAPRVLPVQSKAVSNDGWMLDNIEQGSVTRSIGPYIVSGGWWMRPIHREYHFLETQRGDVLWVYYDRRRRRWFAHGSVQ